VRESGVMEGAADVVGNDGADTEGLIDGVLTRGISVGRLPQEGSCIMQVFISFRSCKWVVVQTRFYRQSQHVASEPLPDDRRARKRSRRECMLSYRDQPAEQQRVGHEGLCGHVGSQLGHGGRCSQCQISSLLPVPRV
jgi:hypothetical protein